MNKIPLDLKDKKILYELDLNARQSCSQIAKKVGLSTEVVNYRIKRLEEEKIIEGYKLIVDLSKLGIIQFKICLQFQHIILSVLNKAIDKLKKNKSIKWVVSCNGGWDLIMSLETNSLKEVYDLKEEILSLFKNYIRKKSISIAINSSNFVRDYFIEKNSSSKERILVGGEGESKIDKRDLTILKQLSENSRKSVVDIAYEIKTTARIVNYRINQMIKNKIISGFNLKINYEKLGIRFYKIFVYLDNQNTEKIKALIKYFENHKNIIHYVTALGNWDLEPEFEVQSEKEFNEILTEIREKFHEVIQSMDIITISKEHKLVYF